MKKESYKLLAAIMLVLVATLTSCEKFSLDESGQSSTHDANANVTVRIHQVQNRTIGEVTKATASGTALKDVCSKVSFVVFDGEEKIEAINQSADDDNFGIARFSLDEGEYRLVVIAHNGKGNCTMTVPEKVKFTSNKLTDTFYYYGKLTVKDDKILADVKLQRAVSAFRLHITDEIIPEEMKSIKFYYTGGSSTLDATSGYGCVNSRQTEVFKLAKDQRDYSVYTFPHEDSQGLNMKISILDADGKTIRELDKDNIEVKCNYITKANISIAESSGDTPGGSDGGDEDDKGDGGFNIQFNPEWEGEITVEFE